MGNEDAPVSHGGAGDGIVDGADGRPFFFEGCVNFGCGQDFFFGERDDCCRAGQGLQLFRVFRALLIFPDRLRVRKVRWLEC